MKAILFRPLTVATVVATICLCASVEARPKLENHDTAFSILIEAFGEVQSAFIENDYQARLEAADSIADPVARRHTCDLAKQERDLRLAKLKRQLTEMTLAYHYSRQTDDSDIGVDAREKIDPAAAARTLSRFVLIGNGTVQTDDETNTPESRSHLINAGAGISEWTRP